MAGFPGMFGDGLAHWHSVSRALKTHWYHVSVKRWEGDRFVSIQEFVSDEPRLHQLLSQQDKSFKVTEVQIVTPGWVNGGESWRMERLQSLAMGYDSNGIPRCVFEVESGVTYHDSHDPDFDINSLNVVHNMYRASV